MPGILEASINLASKEFKRLRIHKADRSHFDGVQRLRVEYGGSFFMTDLDSSALYKKYGEIDHEKLMDWSSNSAAVVRYRLKPCTPGLLEMEILEISQKSKS